MEAFTKIINPGRIDIDRQTVASVFCKIDWDGKRLSITGVEGPKHNGDALGGCGQIVGSLAGIDDFCDGWDADAIARFASIWSRWHLNDMRAGCEHQRCDWKPEEKIEVVTYRLTSGALRSQRATEERLSDAVKAGQTVKATKDEIALLNLPWETVHAPDADGPGSGMYEVLKRETKAAGWVRPDEHSRGLLEKPCDVCGYRYGSAWLHEDVPADVIAELAALPSSTVKPAWV